MANIRIAELAKWIRSPPSYTRPPLLADTRVPRLNNPRDIPGFIPPRKRRQACIIFRFGTEFAYIREAYQAMHIAGKGAFAEKDCTAPAAFTKEYKSGETVLLCNSTAVIMTF